MKDLILQNLPTIWTVILLPLLTVLGKYLVSWIAAKTAGTKWEASIAKFEGLVGSVVQHAEAEIRPLVQKALADGSLSDAESAEIKARVMTLVKEQVLPQVPELAKMLSGPILDTLVSGTIEKLVANMGSDPVADAAKAGAAAAAAIDTPAKADAVPLIDPGQVKGLLLVIGLGLALLPATGRAADANGDGVEDDAPVASVLVLRAGDPAPVEGRFLPTPLWVQHQASVQGTRTERDELRSTVRFQRVVMVVGTVVLVGAASVAGYCIGSPTHCGVK